MGVSASTGKSPGLGKSLAYCAPDKAPTSYWNPEPRVILSNDSDYIVSYWVVEEDKKRASERHQKIARSIGLQLNASSNHNTTNNNSNSNKTNTASGTSSSEDHPKKTQQQQEEALGTEEQEQEVGDGAETSNNDAGGPTSSDYIKNIHNQGKTLETGEEEEEDEVYYLTRDHRMGRKGSTQPTQVPFPADCQHMRVYGFFEKDGEWQCFKDQVYSIALINKNFRITASTSHDTPCSDKKTSRLPKRLLL